MKKRLCLIVVVFCISMLFAVSAYAEKLLYSAAVDGELKLCLSPKDGRVEVVSVPSCAKLRLLKTDGTWGLVNFDNKCGWINLSYTGETYDEAAEATGIECARLVKIKSNDKNVSLYNLPADNEVYESEVKYTVPNGMVVKIIRETTSGWGLVRISDEYAWIKLENTKPYETTAEKSANPYEIYYVYVISNGEGTLNMYSKPGSGSVLAMIPDCTKLTVRETKDKYAYVSYGGINGWVELKFTSTSLYYARSNAGEVIGKEFVTISPDEGKIPVYSIPYDGDVIGNEELGSIDGETEIFVQRATNNGWYLIKHNGILGWISSQYAVEAYEEEIPDEIVFSEKEEKMHTATEKGKGVLIYSDCDRESESFVIPECIPVKVVAHKDNLAYVYSDYVAGWTETQNLCDSYKNALSAGVEDEYQVYHSVNDTGCFNIPAGTGSYGSKKIYSLKKDKVCKVRKIVVTDKEKWALAEVDGKQGFVKFEDLKKGEPTNKKLYVSYVIPGVALLLLAGIVTTIVIRRKKKIDKFSKNG